MLHPAITVVRAVALCLAVSLRPAAANASDNARDSAHDAVAMSLAAARELVGRDPPQALAVIGRLRREAASAGLLDARLAADELECRLRSDLDPEGALRVAEAGIAAARDGAARPSPSPLPLLRLRVCRAAGLIDAEREADGLAELDRVIAAAADPALAPARGLALMERGTARSRAGALTDGQRDLLAACALLAEQPRDGELCNAYLANHYRRVGDLDEALPLARRLLDGARRQGARFDESVYLMILAQIHSQRGEHAQALAGYAEAERFAGVTQDPQGLVKAAYGTALSLLALGRPAEALPQAQRTLALLAGHPDPAQLGSARVLLAQVLLALDRPGEAMAQLAPMAQAVRASGKLALLADWLRTSADTRARLGHWHEAWLALSEWRDTDRRLQAEQHSKASAMLRLQFNRERDDREMQHLRSLNAQSERLRNAQSVALALGALLLVLLGALAVHRLRREREASRLAATDELTGLPNRRALLAHARAAVQSAQRQGSPLALLMVDVDHFKRINDQHGHARGDEVLRLLARQMAGVLRQCDRVGRLGGEEFAAVLPGVGQEPALAIAERMRAEVEAGALSAPSEAAQGLRFTVSIGVAEWRRGESEEQALDRADAALYLAKQRGRNAVVLAPPGPAQGPAAAVPGPRLQSP